MKKVLIIEDEKIIQKITRLSFEKEGYSVSTANNGKEGLDKAVENKPDLIILDLIMPVMDGYQFMEKIKNPTEKETPIVILSNLDSESDKEKAKNYGATEFIVKSETNICDVVKISSLYLV